MTPPLPPPLQEKLSRQNNRAGTLRSGGLTWRCGSSHNEVPVKPVWPYDRRPMRRPADELDPLRALQSQPSPRTARKLTGVEKRRTVECLNMRRPVAGSTPPPSSCGEGAIA